MSRKRWLKDRSEQEREQDIAKLMRLSLPVLRKRQNLLKDQQQRNYEQYIDAFHRNAPTHHIMQTGVNLSEMEADLLDAIDRKTFVYLPKPSPKKKKKS